MSKVKKLGNSRQVNNANKLTAKQRAEAQAKQTMKSIEEMKKNQAIELRKGVISIVTKLNRDRLKGLEFNAEQVDTFIEKIKGDSEDPQVWNNRRILLDHLIYWTESDKGYIHSDEWYFEEMNKRWDYCNK